MPNHPTGVIHDGYQGKLWLIEPRDGYRIFRSWLYATPNEGVAKKTLGHLSFMASSLVLGLTRMARPDVVVVSSPTFFSIFSAWALARRWRVPLVVEVRDLWPGIFVELGILTQRHAIRILERLELAAYSAASTVVVVTEGFKEDLVRRGVPHRKVAVITNGVDPVSFQPGPPSPAVRAFLGASADETLVLYIGAHGISQGLMSIVEAAKMFDDGVRLAFVGEGAEKNRLKEAVAQAGLSNVSFRDGVPRKDVLEILRSVDILLVPLRDIPLFERFIPSKIFEFLAIEGCIVGSVAGEAATILSEAGSVVVAPESPVQLSEAVNELSGDSLRRQRQGHLGRTFVERGYNRRDLAVRYLGELADVVSLAR